MPSVEQRLSHAEHVAASRLYSLNLLNAQLAWEREDVPLAYRYLDRCEEHLRGWEHAYLKSLLQCNQQTLTGHQDGLIEVAFSADETHVASASYDGTVRLWSVNDGREREVFSGHKGYVSAIGFFPDGERLASCGDDGTLRIWSVGGKTPATVIQVFPESCSGLAISPDGKELACSSPHSGDVRVFDAASLAAKRTFEVESAGVNCLAYSHDSRQLLIGDCLGLITIHKRASETPTRVEAYSGIDEVADASFSRDGKRIVSCRRSGATAEVWDAASGERLLQLAGHKPLISGAKFSSDGERIVSTGWDKVVRLWDAQTGEPLKVLKGHTDDVFCAVFSPSGRIIASGSRDKTVKIWNAATTQGEQTFNVRYKSHPLVTNCVAFSPQGDRLLSCGIDSDVVKVWNIEQGTLETKLKGLPSRALVATFAPHGQWVAGGNDAGVVVVWDVATGMSKWHINAFSRELAPDGSDRDSDKSASPSSSEHRVTGLAVSPDEHLLAASSDDHSIRVLDAADGKELYLLRADRPLHSVAFLQGGSLVTCCADNGQTYTWDLGSGEKKVVELEGHTAPVMAAAWSVDGSWLVTAGQDETLRTWDTATGAERCTLRGHTDSVWGVAISPDGKRVASASGDKTVKVWEAATGEELLTLRGHDRDVWATAFSADGRQLASGSYDGSVKVWAGKEP